MKDYKFKITYNGKTLARSSTKGGAEKRYTEIDNYLSNPRIIVNGYGIKNYDRNLLKIEEIA